MLQTLIKFFKHSATTGTYLPAAHDNVTGRGSVTLLLVHISNLIAVASIIYLTIQDRKSGAISAICYASLCIVFYLMRKLKTFKADLDDGSIELDSADEGVGPGENNEQK